MPNWRHTDEARAPYSGGECRASLLLLRATKLLKPIAAANTKRFQPSTAPLSLQPNKDRLFTIDHCDKISDAHIAYHERVNPPLSPAERHRREKRRVYKRALRARRRAAGS